MESPPDPASDPGNGVSEPVTPVRETPVNLETLRKAEHQAPVRRQSCSSTNRDQQETTRNFNKKCDLRSGKRDAMFVCNSMSSHRIYR
ncbi:hypothetical protein Q8A67_025508 [Cirrhinus molitorella]|uniref:Uncharacterized protein n=1 Tax=Cirrhinus molitorella TaxID=172907 RepID=A0AA88NUM8_9TELE|nr:hypothetical protein Q8A67_025508 [Cirrhinus molitorella]